jgi:hypothetical protein
MSNQIKTRVDVAVDVTHEMSLVINIPDDAPYEVAKAMITKTGLKYWKALRSGQAALGPATDSMHSAKIGSVNFMTGEPIWKNSILRSVDSGLALAFNNDLIANKAREIARGLKSGRLSSSEAAMALVSAYDDALPVHAHIQSEVSTDDAIETLVLEGAS